ncbi:SprT-like domain-containing protein [Thermodesulfobacteriota bacterium]
MFNIKSRYSQLSKRKKSVSHKMEKRLETLLDAPASIIITDNTRSMISVNRKNNTYTVRLHHMFIDANTKILEALADFISGKSKKAGNHLKRFIRGNNNKIRIKTDSKIKKKIKILHQGKSFNLLETFERLNTEYFNKEIKCQITWGYRRTRKKQRSVRLGSYSSRTSIIRINPILDRDWVPQYVLESIVYHEMLHHLLGQERSNGRNLSHFSAFKEMEQKFRYYSKAKLWIKNNMDLLLGSCDTST